MMPVRIYHNPACGTSRRTLALILDCGIEPEVVEYLATPPDRPMLLGLLAGLGLPPRGLLRTKEPDYLALGLDDPAMPDDRLVDAMLAHPILIERPIVVTPFGACLCRPAERVLDLLSGP